MLIKLFTSINGIMHNTVVYTSLLLNNLKSPTERKRDFIVVGVDILLVSA